MKAFDNRLVELEISVDGKTLKYDQGFAIMATGMRYTNGNFGECGLRIDNIAKIDRDFIVSKTSPWNPQRTTAEVTLNVGRESYGTFQMFQGNAIACSPTQPPDIGLIMHSLSQSALLGYVNAFAAAPTTSILSICLNIAEMAHLTLDFQGDENQKVTNYHFTGPIGKQVQNLNRLGVDAYIDSGSNTLVVTKPRTPRKMTPIKVNASTGMIGVPEITETGVRVRMLITNEVQIGAPVDLYSTLNPAVNGSYMIFKLGFEIASREAPFYWIMDLIPTANAIGLQ